MQSLDRPIALRTTVHLLVCLGGVAAVSFILSAHWLLILFALPVIVGTWWILYLFEKGLAQWGRPRTSLERDNANTSQGKPGSSEAAIPVTFFPLTAEQIVNLHVKPVEIAPAVPGKRLVVAWPELLQ